MISTTGTTIENYLGWAKNEIEKKQFGEVSLIFTITAGQVTYVQKGSIDKDQIPLKKKSENITICSDGNKVNIHTNNIKYYV